MALWLFGGIILPFFPLASIIFLTILIASIFIPASWFGLK